MKEGKSNFYKSILKATSAFGVFQVLRIFIRLFVGKISAIFLGPSGLGIIGLIDNMLNLISSITGFGLNISGVRQVALDDNTKNEQETISLLNKLAVYSGLLGVIVVIILSPFLSYFVFGTYSKYYWFLLLSVYFIFFSIYTTNNSILQGKRKLKLLLISNFIVTILVAFSSYILYSTFKENAIIPFFLLTAFLSMIISIYALNKVFTNSVEITFKEMIQKSKPLIKMGFLLSTNVIFGQICYYLIRLFLKTQDASVAVLGFYEVGNVFLVSYLGLVFSAMSNDYYPKLTSLSKDKIKFNILVNQQIQVALLIVTPVILFFYAFKSEILKLLYTVDFFPVIEILQFGLLSIILKAIIWPMGFIPLALSDNKEYFKQNIAGDFINVILTIVFYNLFGLKGIGITVLVYFGVFVIYSAYISIKKYQFSFHDATLKIIGSSVIFGTIAFYFSIYEKLQILLFTLFIFSSIVSLFFLYKNLRKPR